MTAVRFLTGRAMGKPDEAETAIYDEPVEIPRSASIDASGAPTGPSSKAVSQTGPGARISPRDLNNRKSWVLPISVVLAVIAVIGAAYLRYSDNAQVLPTTSVAVLRFENGSGNADFDYLSEGVSESIIDRLSQLPQLKVIARSSSFRYRSADVDLRQIAEALNVDTIVTGRVVPRGDVIDVRVELIQAAENKHLWGGHFSRPVADLQVLQTDISREIVESLKLKLSVQQAGVVEYRGTNDPAAYELFLKGRFYFNRAGAPENFHRAVDLLEQAVAIDPNFALAHAGLAEAYGFGGGTGLTRAERAAKIEAAAERAIQLDPELAEAHNAMAAVKRTKWEWAEAERRSQMAIALNPNLAQARAGYALHLNLTGRNTEALAEVKRARELDPAALIVNTVVGVIHLRMRQYDDAITALDRAIELGDSAMFARQSLGTAYAAKGRYQDAIAQYKKAIEIRGGRSAVIEALLGVAYVKIGDRKQGEETLRELMSRGPEGLSAERALLHEALGDREAAFTTLEQAFRLRTPALPFIAVDPAFDPLRDDPRFRSLVSRMGIAG